MRCIEVASSLYLLRLTCKIATLIQGYLEQRQNCSVLVVLVLDIPALIFGTI